MKTNTVLLLFCFLFCSCLKKDYSNTERQKEEKQEVLSQEILDKEIQNPDASYVFDIESFRFIDEFPRTVVDVKTMYPYEPFEERTTKNTFKGYLGDYSYSLKSSNIQFIFWGDSIDDAELCIVEITHQDYQCKTMQVIGMAAEELERVSGKKLTRDKSIIISTDLYVLSIDTQNGIVRNYAIVAEL